MRSEEREQRKERTTVGDIFPKYRISMLDNGRIKRIRIEGAKKLLLCLENEVKISLGKEILHIYGYDLSCGNYAGGAVEVLGGVTSLSFEEKAEGGVKR